MHRHPLSICAFSFVLLASTGAASAQSTKLVFAPPTGKKYNYSLKTDMKAVGVNGMGNMSMTQNVVLAAEILSKSSQGTKVRLKFVSSKTTMPPKGPMASMGSNMDKQIEGAQIESVYDARARQVGAAVSSNPVVAKAMGAGLQAGFLGIELPTGPVSVGSSWKSTLDVSKAAGMMPGMVQFGKNSTVPIVFRLKKLVNKGGKTLAAIETIVKGTVELSLNAGAAQPGAQGMKITISMNMTSNSLVDVATGLPTSEDMKGTVSTAVQGMNIAQNISSTLRMK